MAEPRQSRYQQVSPVAEAMLSLGESGRFEFKRHADDLKPSVFAALANAVALDPERESAHILVGVDEVEDRATGLVFGLPVGLEKGLDRTVARLQDMVSRTKPIPVDVFIVEEAVASEHPFIRIEVRPSMPPHYDDEGRRQRAVGGDEACCVLGESDLAALGINVGSAEHRSALDRDRLVRSALRREGSKTAVLPAAVRNRDAGRPSSGSLTSDAPELASTLLVRHLTTPPNGA